MNDNEFEHLAGENLISPLLSEGYVATDFLDFRKIYDDGFERVAIDFDSRKSNFSIMLSFYPNEIIDVLSMYKTDKEEGEGFICGPYLNPVNVTRHQKYWPIIKKKNIAYAALLDAKESLFTIGFDWLKRLRDPLFFAENVYPSLYLVKGSAYERVPDIDKAMSQYRRSYDEYIGYIKEFGVDDDFLSDDAQAFLFVADKLNINSNLVDEIEKKGTDLFN